ncbi:MAG TPA: HTTM domain-containing protein [Archangium sp.]|nr:HTTM domain-containing protein [Archangium sp.]
MRRMINLLLLLACACGEEGPEPGEELSGGDTTVHDTTRNAFALAARNLQGERRDAFFTGNALFNRNWVTAPASTTGVSEPATGKRWVVSPGQHLSPYQVKMMATQPDMLLTFAHYLARHFAEQGYPGVEVRVDAYASLNGRPRQRLVDPTVNLAAVGPWDGVHGWVLPFREVAPP